METLLEHIILYYVMLEDYTDLSFIAFLVGVITGFLTCAN